MDKYDLNKPAFGEGADSANEPEQTPVGTEQTVGNEEEIEVSEENKVPYSRFKKYHDGFKEAEAEAQRLREEVASLREQRTFTPQEEPNELPSYWKELFGDSEASEKAWKVEQQRQQSLREELREDAIRAVYEQQSQQENAIKENVATIDENLEDLSSKIGRDLTEKEQSALLDIVDEFTPKDERGNYLGAVIPFDKAWEIYELKTGAVNKPRQEARSQVASLSGQATQGETNFNEKNQNWNPLDWNAWQRRL